MIERGSGQNAGVEVKTSVTALDKDFRGLKKPAQAAGKRFCRGVVPYNGEFNIPLNGRFYGRAHPSVVGAT